MPLEENIRTYRYFLSEADKLNLSYITLRRYSPLLDAEFDGSSFRFPSIHLFDSHDERSQERTGPRFTTFSNHTFRALSMLKYF